MGSSAPDLYVKSEVKANAFSIAGGDSGQKVSWQLTGIPPGRLGQRFTESRSKKRSRPPTAGLYLHPTEHGQPAAKGIDAVRKRRDEAAHEQVADRVGRTSAQTDVGPAHCTALPPGRLIHAVKARPRRTRGAQLSASSFAFGAANSASVSTPLARNASSFVSWSTMSGFGLLCHRDAASPNPGD